MQLTSFLENSRLTIALNGEIDQIGRASCRERV